MDQEHGLDPNSEEPKNTAENGMIPPVGEPDSAAETAVSPASGLVEPTGDAALGPALLPGDGQSDSQPEGDSTLLPGETGGLSEEPGDQAESSSTAMDPADAETKTEKAAPAETADKTGAAVESQWFVVHCYSGYENKVRHNLEQRIETMGMRDKIFDVVIPTQEEVEVKDGKRRVVERHVFPGYVLVNMILSDESWFVVRNTPGVTGFVGMGNDPTPLRPDEVAQILKRMEAEAPHIKVTFKLGERVRIVDGPFNDFRGTVAEIDMDRTKVRVMVNFFGRETPVELDFLQVEKS